MRNLTLELIVAAQTIITNRARDERGASAVEYGLLVAGIAALISLVVYAFGGGVGGLFQGTCDTIQASRSTTC